MLTHLALLEICEWCRWGWAVGLWRSLNQQGCLWEKQPHQVLELQIEHNKEKTDLTCSSNSATLCHHTNTSMHSNTHHTHNFVHKNIKDKIRDEYLVTIRGVQVPSYYQRRSSTLLLSEEVKYLVTIREGQVPSYYQRRLSTLLISEEVKYLVTKWGQVPCYYQRRSSTLLLSEEVKYLVTLMEVKYIVTIRGAQYLVTIRRGQVPW